MGAPGSSYWTGSLFVYNITTNKYKAFLDTNNQVKFGSYLGTVKMDKLQSSQSYRYKFPLFMIISLFKRSKWPVAVKEFRNYRFKDIIYET